MLTTTQATRAGTYDREPTNFVALLRGINVGQASRGVEGGIGAEPALPKARDVVVGP
jgi:hypothetical protein